MVATGGYLTYMRAIGVEELRDHLSEYVRLAAAGGLVLVTDRDRVVAELNAPRAERGVEVGDVLMLVELVRNGIARPPLRRGEAPGRMPSAPTRALLEELDRDREDR